MAYLVKVAYNRALVVSEDDDTASALAHSVLVETDWDGNVLTFPLPVRPTMTHIPNIVRLAVQDALEESDQDTLEKYAVKSADSKKLQEESDAKYAQRKADEEAQKVKEAAEAAIEAEVERRVRARLGTE